MVRSTKPATNSAVAPVVAAAPAVVAAPASEPVVAKKATKKAAKTETPVAAAPAAPVVVAPVVENVVVDITAAPLADKEPELVVSSETKLNEVDAKIQQIGSILSTLKSDFKILRKSVQRERKLAEKSKVRGAKRSSGNRKPSGFIKPTLISDELASFLGKASGTEMARTDVSKEINSYIVANNLKDKTNGRIIHPDAKLTALLKISSNNELTFFNLQSYMKHHFIKTTPVATA